MGKHDPNFLDLFFNRKLSRGEWFFLVFAGLILGGFVVYSPRFIVLFAFIALVLLFAYHLDWGVYVLGFFAFFLGWQLDFTQYTWARDVPYLAGVNAPVVDFVAMILLFSLFVASIFGLSKVEWRGFWKKIPGWHWYALFLVVAFVSFLSVYENEFGTSLKYFLRPMVFVYIMFVFLPVMLVSGRKVLDNLLKLWFWLGSLIAVFGLSSLFFVSQSAWIRAMPYGIKGFAPLGYNHNLLAEPLIIIIPIGFYLFFRTKDVVLRRFYLFGIALMLGVALLTLSRAAWLALLVEGVFFAYFFRHKIRGVFHRFPSFKLVLLVLLVPILLYMGLFLRSFVVESSTTARVVTSDITWFYLKRAPLIGHGPGSYIPLLRDTFIHRVEFGAPLESHGFLQKILLEEGIVGFVFFALFLFSVLLLLWKRQRLGDDRELYQVLFLSLIGIVLFEVFNTSYFNSVMWLPIGVAVAAVSLGEK